MFPLESRDSFNNQYLRAWRCNAQIEPMTYSTYKSSKLCPFCAGESTVLSVFYLTTADNEKKRKPLIDKGISFIIKGVESYAKRVFFVLRIQWSNS
jgi:hypothetical protein